MTQFEEDIVKSVTEDYERRREARRPLELQWRLSRRPSGLRKTNKAVNFSALRDKRSSVIV